jgi:cytochrome oxidase Cu insertion factor (SCO1/SenC/PrrC family)
MAAERRSGRWRIAGVVLLVLVCLWGAGVAFIAQAMRKPPEKFAQVMKHVPGPAFMLIPFETLWNGARKGTLEPGIAAPEFKLSTTDHTKSVALSQLRGRPVVLVFGSYT